MAERKVTIDDRRAIAPEVRNLRNLSAYGYEQCIQTLLCRRIGISCFNAPESVILAAQEMARPLIRRDEEDKVIQILKGQ